MRFDDLNNYYENLVYDELSRLAKTQSELSDDTLKDIACVALNKLPAQYIRYSVDVAFFLSSEEKKAIDNSVRAAINEAKEFVLSHPRSAA